MLGERGRKSPGHAGPGLRPEVLDDDLLDVAVAIVKLAQCKKRLDAFGARLSDADEDAARERDGRLTGKPDGCKACGRRLVRRTVMRSAALAEAFRGAFQHDPLRNR